MLELSVNSYKKNGVFMLGKYIKVTLLSVAGVYFLAFHAEPFPFSHNAIGLPPFHVLHAIFGLLLLFGAVRVWKK